MIGAHSGEFLSGIDLWKEVATFWLEIIQQSIYPQSVSLHTATIASEVTLLTFLSYICKGTLDTQ